MDLHRNYRINSYLELVESLNIQINDVSRKIFLTAKQGEIAKLLMTIPGIGYYSAILIISEIVSLIHIIYALMMV